jgi:two-component system sensor histidine kinase KdpD
LSDICRAAIGASTVAGVTMSVDEAEAIEADQSRLVQALTNLITNASKYGNGRIHVVGRKSGDQIELEVHDDGPGVPVRFQERVFEKFERGAHRFDAATPGMGVGLAIVRAIAQAHGGSIDYRKSELLGGACFSVNVPVTSTRAMNEAPMPPPVRSLVS